MIARVFLVAGLVVVGVAAYAIGLFDLLSDPERVRSLLLESGAWGPILYVVAFGLLEPFGAPGILFIVPAAMVWPTAIAALLSWLGAVLAGLVGFSFSRWVARDWVEHHMPERLRAYDDRLAERGLQTVVVVRLLFFLLPPAHWALGLSRVRLAPFLLGSAIGFIPGIIALTLLGRGILESPRGIGIVAVVAFLLYVVCNRRRQRDSG